MAERPILFSAQMVKAILQGEKTQTRRVLKAEWLSSAYSFVHLKKSLGFPASEGFMWAGFVANYSLSPCYLKCPYGMVGDQLWVREAYRFGQAPADEPGQGIAMYTDGSHQCHPTLDPKRLTWCRAWKKRPSIHMPRWASRITLEITDIRVEKLQAISEEDARREGVASWSDTIGGTVYKPEFQTLWDQINAERGYGWDKNPWVWAISFGVIEKAE